MLPERDYRGITVGPWIANCFSATQQSAQRLVSPNINRALCMAGLSVSVVHPIRTVSTWKKVGLCFNHLFFNPTIFTRILPVGATLVPTETIKKGKNMHRTRESLSSNGVCAVYQCLEGHIHFKYRSIDIAMTPQDFYQVAGTIAEAMLTFKDDDTQTLTDRDRPITV